jgi:hypothetical protein
MWHGGGRAPVPAARESSGGGQREAREWGSEAGRWAGSEWGPTAEREEEGREEERPTGGTGSGGPAGRERRERALTGGPLGLNKFDLFQTNSTHSNFIWSKQDPPLLKKFEIKYDWKVFDIRNNFVHRIFLRFWMDFALKFRETSMRWIPIEILGTLEFDKFWLACC